MNKILKAIESNAVSKPRQIAFRGQNHIGDVQSISYFELNKEVDMVANLFLAMQAKCIALRADNSLDWLVIDLAAMKAKVCLVPVPTFFTDQQVEHTLAESGADVLVGDWKDKVDPITCIRNMPIYLYASGNERRYLPETSKITFTSGSTGSPKGVCLSEQNIENVSLALAKSMEADQVCHLSLLPLSTLLENVTSIYVPILLGITSQIYKSETLGLTGSSQLNVKAFAEALVQFQPNSMVLVPAILMALIQLVSREPALSDSLKFVAVGGARVAPELIEQAHQLGIPAYEGYGLSEFASVVSLNTENHSKAGTSGRLLPHVEAKLSEENELLIKGNSALGYINEPFTDEWFATGDLASIDSEGYVTIEGRKKNQIISGFGRNISPEWVESRAQVFLPECPMVVTGDAEASLTAIVGAGKAIEERIERLNQTLPDYARIKNLLIVSDMSARKEWFTSNGRPKRKHIESWASCIHKQYIADPLVTAKTVKTQFEYSEI